MSRPERQTIPATSGFYWLKIAEKPDFAPWDSGFKVYGWLPAFVRVGELANDCTYELIGRNQNFWWYSSLHVVVACEGPILNPSERDAALATLKEAKKKGKKPEALITVHS